MRPNQAAFDETTSRRSWRDPLLLAIAGMAAGLAILIVSMKVLWGSGPVLAEIPWVQPMVTTLNSLTALSVAFLALGRYRVLGDPVSYWIGLGFAAHGVGQVFYVLAWPGLLPDGSAIITRLTSTPAFIVDFNLTVFGGFLLAAVLVRAPEKSRQAGQPWLWGVTAWLVMITVSYGLMVAFEQYLPVLVRADGVFTPLLAGWAAALLLLFASGAVLSARAYRVSGDALAGYVALVQMIMAFIILMTILGGKRYDLWWYTQRLIQVGGYLLVLFGLFSEYVRLFRREKEGRMLLDTINDRLQKSEERYRVAMMNFPAVYAQTDAELRYTWIHNPHPDFQAGDVLGKRDDELEDSQDSRRLVDLKRQVLESGVGLRTELAFHRSDGVKTYDTTIEPLRDSRGQIAGVTTAALDITDRKRVEEALRKHAAELERTYRDLQNFTVVASHDLQEPLRKIEALGDAIMESAGEGASDLNMRQQDLIQRMRKSACQMRSMVNGLMQLSLLSTDVQSFQPVDLRQVTREIVGELAERIDRVGGVVEVGELPVIDADPGQIRRLLQHLIENALKFQPPGARPHVAVFSKPLAGGMVQMIVKDNGIGFDEAHARHLFKPFERLVGKKQVEYDGIGMGLAICRWIVEHHNGEITVYSQSGQGTTFMITLPVHQETLVMEDHRTGNSGAGNNWTI